MFPGFYLFDKYISSYVLTSLAGIFTACPLAIYHYKKRGGNDIGMIFVFLFGGIGCMFGMHLLYGITNIRQWGSLFSAASFGDWLEAAQLIFGGAVFYGGLIGGLAVGFLSIRYQKLDTAVVSDCAAPSIALFLALTLLLVSGKLRGKLLAVYLLVYPVGRFLLEFWRGDEYRGFLFGLSTSQLISIALFIGTIVFLAVSAVKKRRTPMPIEE